MSSAALPPVKTTATSVVVRVLVPISDSQYCAINKEGHLALPEATPNEGESYVVTALRAGFSAGIPLNVEPQPFFSHTENNLEVYWYLGIPHNPTFKPSLFINVDRLSQDAYSKEALLASRIPRDMSPPDQLLQQVCDFPHDALVRQWPKSYEESLTLQCLIHILAPYGFRLCHFDSESYVFGGPADSAVELSPTFCRFHYRGQKSLKRYVTSSQYHFDLYSLVRLLQSAPLRADKLTITQNGIQQSVNLFDYVKCLHILDQKPLHPLTVLKSIATHTHFPSPHIQASLQYFRPLLQAINEYSTFDVPLPGTTFSIKRLDLSAFAAAQPSILKALAEQDLSHLLTQL